MTEFNRTTMRDLALQNMRNELVAKKKIEFTKQIKNDATNGEVDTILQVSSLRGGERQHIRNYLEKRGFTVTPVTDTTEWMVTW